MTNKNNEHKINHKKVKESVKALREISVYIASKQHELKSLKEIRSRIRKEFLDKLSSINQKINSVEKEIKDIETILKPLLDTKTKYKGRKNYYRRENIGKKAIITQHGKQYTIEYTQHGWVVDGNFVGNMHRVIKAVNVKYYSRIVEQLEQQGFKF